MQIEVPDEKIQEHLLAAITDPLRQGNPLRRAADDAARALEPRIARLMAEEIETALNSDGFREAVRAAITQAAGELLRDRIKRYGLVRQDAVRAAIAQALQMGLEAKCD